MKLGIKTGLKSQWKRDLDESKPDFTEVWFHSGQIERYQDLFAYLQANKIPLGLHFWGFLPDMTLANFAYPDKEILAYSRQLVKSTIDEAARHNALYVNLHPNGTGLCKVDFDNEKFTPVGQEAPMKDCLKNLRESFTILADYASKHGIPLLVESVPKLAMGHPWTGFAGRLKPVFIGEFDVSVIETVMDIDNLYFANDLGHTAATVISDNRDHVAKKVVSVTKRLAQKTKLIHVSYVIPPYNGTDYHGCLYYDEFLTTKAVPNKTEMIKLLKIFAHRDDVYGLVEPETDHVGNFKVLKKLVS